MLFVTKSNMLDRKTNDKIKKIISVFSICINKECKMNSLVCEHFTALLRDESKIEDAFLATLWIFTWIFFRTYLNYFTISLKALENILPFPLIRRNAKHLGLFRILIDHKTVQHEQLKWAFWIHPLDRCPSLCQ